MKKIILSVLFTLLILLLIGIGFNVHFVSNLISNDKTYDSCLSIDKENELLIVNKNQKIKILQLSDIQINNYFEVARSFDIAKEAIERTSPDLIVLTGDNLNEMAWGIHLKRLINFMDSFGIPWAPVYGNHDYRVKMLSIKRQNKMFENSKYCLFKKGSVENSNGNYCYNIKKADKLIYSIICMDSKEKGFEPAHLTWYENKINNSKQLNGGNIVPSLVFFHIPIEELQYAYDLYLEKPEVGNGDIGEPLSFQDINIGLYDKAKELGSTKAFIFGHDHVNTLHIKYQDIMFCYGLKTGRTSYYDDEIQGACLYTINEDLSLTTEKIYI